LNQTLDDLLAKIKKLEDMVAHLNHDIEDKDNQIHNLTIANNELNSELTTLREQLNRITRIKFELEETVKSLR
jgi:chromosome segregation ATPase